MADTNRNTRIHAIRNGSEAWRYPLGGASDRQPALTRDGRLYAGTQAGRMHALQPVPLSRSRFPSTAKVPRSTSAPGLLRFEDISLNERLATNESVAGLLGPHIGPISASLGQAVAFGAYSISGEEGLSDEAVPVRLIFTATEPGTAKLQVSEAQVSDMHGTLAQSRRGSTEIEVVER